MKKLVTARRRGILWTPESIPPSTPPRGNPLGTRPQWDAESAENREAWTDIFCEIFDETREVRATRKESA